MCQGSACGAGCARQITSTSAFCRLGGVRRVYREGARRQHQNGEVSRWQGRLSCPSAQQPPKRSSPRRASSPSSSFSSWSWLARANYNLLPKTRCFIIVLRATTVALALIVDPFARLYWHSLKEHLSNIVVSPFPRRRDLSSFTASFTTDSVINESLSILRSGFKAVARMSDKLGNRAIIGLNFFGGEWSASLLL